MPSSVRRRVARPVVRALVRGLSEVTARSLARYSPDEAIGFDVPHRVFSRHGFNLLERNFFLPIPDEEDLDEAFWRRRSDLVGVDVNEPAALALLDDVLPRYAREFGQAVPVHQDDPASNVFLVNGSFMAVDAEVYYALIRHLRPRRIVEVGAGWSTLFSAEAVRAGEREDGRRTDLVAVDPYPLPFLKQPIDGLSRLVERKVQDLDLELFTSLEAGDILFIDSTHVLRSGGDVQAEYCEILPRLQPGVVVHVHDINLPVEYPRHYLEGYRYFFNEQYLLQAFLAFNSRFEMLWPARHMLLNHPERVRALSAGYDAMKWRYPHLEPSSFWMRVRA